MAIKYDTTKPPFHLLPADTYTVVEATLPDKLEPWPRLTWSVWWSCRAKQRQGTVNVNTPALIRATYQLVHSLDNEHPLGGWGALTEVFASGSVIYGDHNWCLPPYFKWSRIWRSIMSHRIKADLVTREGAQGYVVNEEDSDLPHHWHEIWGYVALLTYVLRGNGKDNRPCIDTTSTPRVG